MVEHEQLSAGVRSRRREHEQLSAGTAGRGRGVDGLGATRAWVGTLARSRGTLARRTVSMGGKILGRRLTELGD